MPISIRCPSCRAEFKIRDELAGRKGKCPKCKAVFEAPAAGSSAAAVSATEKPAAEARSRPKPARAAKRKANLTETERFTTSRKTVLAESGQPPLAPVKAAAASPPQQIPRGKPVASDNDDEEAPVAAVRAVAVPVGQLAPMGTAVGSFPGPTIPSRRPHAHRPAPSRVPGWVWMILGVMTGGVGAGAAWYFYFLPGPTELAAVDEAKSEQAKEQTERGAADDKVAEDAGLVRPDGADGRKRAGDDREAGDEANPRTVADPSSAPATEAYDDEALAHDAANNVGKRADADSPRKSWPIPKRKDKGPFGGGEPVGEFDAPENKRTQITIHRGGPKDGQTTIQRVGPENPDTSDGDAAGEGEAAESGEGAQALAEKIVKLTQEGEAFGWQASQPAQYAKLAELAQSMMTAMGGLGPGREAATAAFDSMCKATWTKSQVEALNKQVTKAPGDAGSGFFAVVTIQGLNESGALATLGDAGRQYLILVDPATLGSTKPGELCLVVGQCEEETEIAGADGETKTIRQIKQEFLLAGIEYPIQSIDPGKPKAPAGKRGLKP